MPKKEKISIKDKVVVFPDIHFPNHDEKAFKCALKVILKVEPTAFLLLGDFSDGESVSHWKWSRRKRPPLEYQLPEIDKEAKEVNHGLDRIDHVLQAVNCEKKVVAQGNHEIWYDNFVEENPYLKQYRSDFLFKMNERGYEWHKYGKYFKVFGSKLYAYHGGHYNGINHCRSHAQNLGASVIYGHTHDSQKAVVQHLSGSHMAHSLGCLTDMEKSYLKGRPTNWSHNVGIIDIFNNGNWNLNVLEIHNGKTSYGGEIIG